MFRPVGWEDTLGGVGRPQELINKDLRECDYAVFILHDRWGSPTGGGYTSGTEEEWTIAEELYKANKIRNIALFFKDVDARQLRDPGEQLRLVLTFKRKIEGGKRYLFRGYQTLKQFSEFLEGHLGQWLRDHESAASGGSAGDLLGSSVEVVGTLTGSPAAASPTFDYWIEEALRLSSGDVLTTLALYSVP